MKEKKPTRKELIDRIYDLEKDNERLAGTQTMVVLECQNVLGALDRALTDHCDIVTIEKVRKSISEYTRPEGESTIIT